MNYCVFTGRLTRDPKKIETLSEKKITKFTIASGDSKYVKFIPITAYDKYAEIAIKNLHKGRNVLVECYANPYKYTNSKNENTYGIDFIVKRIEFLDRKEIPPLSTVIPFENTINKEELL